MIGCDYLAEPPELFMNLIFIPILGDEFQFFGVVRHQKAVDTVKWLRR